MIPPGAPSSSVQRPPTPVQPPGQEVLRPAEGRHHPWPQVRQAQWCHLYWRLDQLPQNWSGVSQAQGCQLLYKWLQNLRPPPPSSSSPPARSFLSIDQRINLGIIHRCIYLSYQLHFYLSRILQHTSCSSYLLLWLRLVSQAEELSIRMWESNDLRRPASANWHVEGKWSYRMTGTALSEGESIGYRKSCKKWKYTWCMSWWRCQCSGAAVMRIICVYSLTLGLALLLHSGSFPSAFIFCLFFVHRDWPLLEQCALATYT